jgi:hypothetical protein
MQRRLLRCTIVAFAALGVSTPVIAHVTALTDIGQIKLPPNSHETALHGSAQLFGFPVQIRLFETPIAVPQVIRFFSTQLPLLRDLHVLNGSALLSGQTNGRSWVIHLQGRSQGGTRGTLSLLESRTENPLSPVRPQWLPSRARLLFDLRTIEGSWLTTEQIWSHSIAPNPMRTMLQTALIHLGWKCTHTEFGGGNWQLGEQDLVYSVVVLGRGSAIFARIRQRA